MLVRRAYAVTYSNMKAYGGHEASLQEFLTRPSARCTPNPIMQLAEIEDKSIVPIHNTTVENHSGLVSKFQGTCKQQSLKARYPRKILTFVSIQQGRIPPVSHVIWQVPNYARCVIWVRSLGVPPIIIESFSHRLHQVRFPSPFCSGSELGTSANLHTSTLLIIFKDQVSATTGAVLSAKGWSIDDAPSPLPTTQAAVPLAIHFWQRELEPVPAPVLVLSGRYTAPWGPL